MSNNLANESSPYLLQHKDNPVNWYPWGKEAFEKAKNENKPVFLSIGYSTCHWCHVMAHESFEDAETAELLNKYFVSVKVDREERPDIDSIYMSVCQAMRGGGGWPMSLFLTPEQKPFFAGTYFPKPTFQSLLKQINKLWQTEREKLVLSGNEIEKAIRRENSVQGEATRSIIDKAYNQLEHSFDKEYGGFGGAPKFPMPHNLIFLMDYYRVTDKKQALDMAEYTLTQMYKGGIFDHIGGGFSRYSTDRYYLAPHFEKMLYDNALLIISYINAYAVTNNEMYREIAERTAKYVMREMTDGQGGFYSAQDADSEGEEGKYYTFNYDEIPELLGKEAGEKFNDYYGITKHGNFEGKNIPNLLGNTEIDDRMSQYLPEVYEYRKSRTKLHLDDKILTSWNGLMIAAFARLYRIIGDSKYLDTAEKACDFIEEKLAKGDTLYVSYRAGRHGSNGFVDDYAFYIYALICLYEATFKQKYLDRAVELCYKTVNDFYDNKNGGFYLYGSENEQLIMKPKETYDGAIPSGNSVMAYNLVMLSQFMDGDFSDIKEKQLEFMAGAAEDYPSGYCFYMSALLMNINPPTHIVCSLVDEHIGSQLSTTKIANTMTSSGRKIDPKTVEKYLKALLDSMMIYQAKRYNIKGKQYLKTLEKYYVVDIGLRYMLLGKRSTDVGHILENIVYLELIRRGYDVYVGQSGDAEVDFVAMNLDGITYFQVSASVRDEKTLERELASLKKINDNYPKYILTLDNDPIADYDGIKRINALDWLLNKLK